MLSDKANILVVDDSATNLRLLSVMLVSLGYQVLQAPSGEKALTAIETTVPDLVLLDVSLPGIDGYQVCQTLKANDRTQEIPVIFISALDEVMDKVKGFSVGGVDYITKPFQIAEVRIRVQTHLALRQLQQELQHKNQLLLAERSLAGKIQSDLLPNITPSLAGFEIAAYCVPSRDVGGDFYDWQKLGEDRLNLTLGDVMGKGMPAALLMTTVRATLRALGMQDSPIPSRILCAQQLLEQDLGHSESFVTLFHGQLNCQSRQMDYIDAGHGLALIRRANGDIERLVKGGIPMGILPDQNYKTGQITFSQNDTLILFSDGLSEVFPDAAQRPEIFGPLLQGALGATEMLEKIFTQIPANVERSDDVTVLVLSCQSGL
jgi:serine phosphatase RsbU (regulator of sigma subunit)